MTNLKITALEAKLLNAIAHSFFTLTNGATPKCASDTYTWLHLDTFAGDMDCTVDQVKGILTSIKKKGWVQCDDEDIDEATIYLTDLGFAAFQTVDEDQIHECGICGKIFKSVRGLKIHMGRTDCGKEATIALQGLEIRTKISDQRTCLCGCGLIVEGKRVFRQGHDMKLKSMIKSGIVYITDDQKAYAEANWSIFYTKYTK